MTNLVIKTTGVKGGKPKTTEVGEVTAREWVNGKQTGEITVDCFTGSGNTYKRREQALINIQFADGSIWSGNFSDLQQRLISKDIKTEEKLAELRTRPVSRTLEQPQ